jgi:hypothetical protein
MAEGTDTGLWLAWVPDRFTEPEPFRVGLPVLAGLADVAHGPGLDVLPGGCLRGRALEPFLPVDPDGTGVCRPTMAELLPSPEPPVPEINGWTSPLPPFSMVELTWTSAARSGGTATAAAVIDAAAARPATSRIHPMPCGRKVVQSDAAQRPPDAAAVRPADMPVHFASRTRKIAGSEAAQRPWDAASQMPASQARVARIARATRRMAGWSRQ